jgi:hypothetical protein
MGEYITSYKDKKVSDYLNTGKYKSALFIFHHGLGDCVMWQPVFHEIKRLYPSINIYQNLHCGQGSLFSSASGDKSLYDIVFCIGFPCNDIAHPEYTKAEYCCIVELGITPPNTAVRLNNEFQTPIVGTHFFSTSCPTTQGIPEWAARKIHSAILEEDFIPLDTDMRHVWANSCNKRFSWNTCSIDMAKADLVKLSGVIQNCRGFCGAASGNLLLATTLLPTYKILYIKNNMPLETFTRLPLLTVDINKYDAGVVTEWLRRLKEDVCFH